MRAAKACQVKTQPIIMPSTRDSVTEDSETAASPAVLLPASSMVDVILALAACCAQHRVSWSAADNVVPCVSFGPHDPVRFGRELIWTHTAVLASNTGGMVVRDTAAVFKF